MHSTRPMRKKAIHQQKRLIETFGKKTPTHDDDFLRDEGFVFRNMIDLIKIYLTRVKKPYYTFHVQCIDNK